MKIKVKRFIWIQSKTSKKNLTSLAMTDFTMPNLKKGNTTEFKNLYSALVFKDNPISI